MKNPIILVFFMPFIFSSCYKKLYNECLNDQSIIKSNNEMLLEENTLLIKQHAIAQKEQDSLKNASFALSNQYTNLKSENDRLKVLVEQELDTVKKAMIAYFQRVAMIARNNNPPCSNAANGWFRQFMIDHSVYQLANPGINPVTKKATNLLTTFTSFSNSNQAAFKNNPNHKLSDWLSFRSFIYDNGGKILKILVDIINASNSDNSNKSWAQAAKDAGELYNSMKNSGKCHKGTHANGHISSGVKSAAASALSLLNSYPAEDPSTKAGKIRIVLTDFLNDLLRLPTEGHDPWLRADWQIGYYSITITATKRLSGLE